MFAWITVALLSNGIPSTKLQIKKNMRSFMCFIFVPVKTIILFYCFYASTANHLFFFNLITLFLYVTHNVSMSLKIISESWNNHDQVLSHVLLIFFLNADWLVATNPAFSLVENDFVHVLLQRSPWLLQ